MHERADLKKHCNKCDQDLDIEQFSFKSRKTGRRQSWCRTCQASYGREHYAKNINQYKEKTRRSNARNKQRSMAWIMTYLSTHPCVDCGEADPIVLDFDHITGDKKINVADALNKGKYGIKKLAAEVEKCVVRCANCHRRKTAKAHGFWKTKWKGQSLQPYMRECDGKRYSEGRKSKKKLMSRRRRK